MTRTADLTAASGVQVASPKSDNKAEPAIDLLDLNDDESAADIPHSNGNHAPASADANPFGDLDTPPVAAAPPKPSGEPCLSGNEPVCAPLVMLTR